MLRGRMPRPSSYPRKLRRTAGERWSATARATLAYAKANHAPAGRLTEVAGAVATAAVQTAHAVLAARGEWVTNEKRLLERAGLRTVDDVLAAMAARADGKDPGALEQAIECAQVLFDEAVRGLRS